MPRVLAIDPGNLCGFAVVGDDGLECSGTWHLKRDPTEPIGRRFFRLFHRLAEVDPTDAVAFETKFALPGTGTKNLLNTGGYLGVIRTWCVQHEIADVREMAPSSLKKRAIGHGGASKADMAAWASEQAGRVIADDNEADAVCLAFVVHEELT